MSVAAESKMPIINEPIANMKDLGGFPPTERWNILEHTDEVVLDPVNEFAFRAPTLEEADNPTTPKHNYNETFDCPVFTGNSRVKNEDGEPQVRTNGEPQARWLSDYKLNVNSHPVDWMNAILPSDLFHPKTGCSLSFSGM